MTLLGATKTKECCVFLLYFLLPSHSFSFVFHFFLFRSLSSSSFCTNFIAFFFSFVHFAIFSPPLHFYYFRCLYIYIRCCAYRSADLFIYYHDFVNLFFVLRFFARVRLRISASVLFFLSTYTYVGWFCVFGSRSFNHSEHNILMGRKINEINEIRPYAPFFWQAVRFNPSFR